MAEPLENLSANDTENFLLEAPLGNRKPLLSSTPLGQNFLLPKFISPLGAKPLNVIDLSFLSSNEPGLQGFFDEDFWQDFSWGNSQPDKNDNFLEQPPTSEAKPTESMTPIDSNVVQNQPEILTNYRPVKIDRKRNKINNIPKPIKSTDHFFQRDAGNIRTKKLNHQSTENSELSSVTPEIQTNIESASIPASNHNYIENYSVNVFPNAISGEDRNEATVNDTKSPNIQASVSSDSISSNEQPVINQNTSINSKANSIIYNNEASTSINHPIQRFQNFSHSAANEPQSSVENLQESSPQLYNYTPVSDLNHPSGSTSTTEVSLQKAEATFDEIADVSVSDDSVSELDNFTVASPNQPGDRTELISHDASRSALTDQSATRDFQVQKQPESTGVESETPEVITSERYNNSQSFVQKAPATSEVASTALPDNSTIGDRFSVAEEPLLAQRLSPDTETVTSQPLIAQKSPLIQKKDSASETVSISESLTVNTGDQKTGEKSAIAKRVGRHIASSNDHYSLENSSLVQKQETIPETVKLPQSATPASSDIQKISGASETTTKGNNQIQTPASKATNKSLIQRAGELYQNIKKQLNLPSQQKTTKTSGIEPTTATWQESSTPYGLEAIAPSFAPISSGKDSSLVQKVEKFPESTDSSYLPSLQQSIDNQTAASTNASIQKTKSNASIYQPTLSTNSRNALPQTSELIETSVTPVTDASIQKAESDASIYQPTLSTNSSNALPQTSESIETNIAQLTDANIQKSESSDSIHQPTLSTDSINKLPQTSDSIETNIAQFTDANIQKAESDASIYHPTLPTDSINELPQNRDSIETNIAQVTAASIQKSESNASIHQPSSPTNSSNKFSQTSESIETSIAQVTNASIQKSESSDSIHQPTLPTDSSESIGTNITQFTDASIQKSESNASIYQPTLPTNSGNALPQTNESIETNITQFTDYSIQKSESDTSIYQPTLSTNSSNALPQTSESIETSVTQLTDASIQKAESSDSIHQPTIPTNSSNKLPQTSFSIETNIAQFTDASIQKSDSDASIHQPNLPTNSSNALPQTNESIETNITQFTDYSIQKVESSYSIYQPSLPSNSSNELPQTSESIDNQTAASTNVSPSLERSPTEVEINSVLQRELLPDDTRSQTPETLAVSDPGKTDNQLEIDLWDETAIPPSPIQRQVEFDSTEAIPDAWTSIEELMGESQAIPDPSTVVQTFSNQKESPKPQPKPKQQQSDIRNSMMLPPGVNMGVNGPKSLGLMEQPTALQQLMQESLKTSGQIKDAIASRTAQPLEPIQSEDLKTLLPGLQSNEKQEKTQEQKDFSAAFEALAREIYALLRQRLEVEKERHGFYYSGRSNW